MGSNKSQTFPTAALFGWYGSIPKVYVDAGFGGYINFRGFNYVVDFAGVPNINQFYFYEEV